MSAPTLTSASVSPFDHYRTLDLSRAFWKDGDTAIDEQVTFPTHPDLETYSALREQQATWLRWRRSTDDGTWDRFVVEHPQGARRIDDSIECFNETAPHGIELGGVDLCLAHLVGIELVAAQLVDADLRGADLRGANLSGAVLNGAKLQRANLGGASLNSANLTNARLKGANLTGADFTGVRLGQTDLKNVHFDPSHQAMHDGSDSIVLSGRDRFLSWGNLRFIGTLPLFGVSYAAFGAGLLVVHTIDFLNRYRDAALTVPDRTMVLLLSSILLMIGTTIYKLACPRRVQAFSETQWVEELGHPRLQYLGASLTHSWQLPAAAFTVLGGLLGTWLLLDRLWAAVGMIRQTMM